MLIIPMTGRVSWRNPPFITILLILVNCFIYFGIQSRDEDKYRSAGAFYMESGLAEIEIDRFMEYMSAANRAEEISLPANKTKKDPIAIAYLHRKMVKEREFMRRLNNYEVVTAKDAVFSKWKGLRKDYEQRLSEIIGEKYGYKPADGNLKSAFTYAFLHGSALHLIGNMIFLWLVGCTLELTGRRSAYGLIYLLTGMASALFFGLIYKGSVVSLVGASGAIAGIIGAYTVLYGMRKVKIFYSFGFYFNYARVAAIFLLPVWIGNEIFQLYFGGTSNVAYVAHLGGLLSGAALGLVQKKLLGGVKGDVLQNDRAERIASLMESGLQKFSELDLQGARMLMNQVLELDPENRAALTHLFNIEKLNPEREEFHATAAKLLLHLHRDSQVDEALFDIYQEYCRKAKPPRLSPDIWSRLSSAFSQWGRIEDSARIVAILLRNCPQFPAVPTTLLNLARAYLKAGIEDRGEKCLRMLCERYPHSAESQIAQGLRKGI